MTAFSSPLRRRPLATVADSPAHLNRPTRVLQHLSQIGLRRSQRPDRTGNRILAFGESGDQLLQLVDAGVELSALLIHCAQDGVEVVDHVPDQLITRSEVGVNELVDDSSCESAPPCPCSNSMTALLTSLTLLPSKPLSTGRKPPSSASRSSAGSVFSLRMVPAGSLRSSPGRT